MAIVNKIRERSGIAIGVIAVALLLFIVGGDFIAGRSGGSFLGGSDNKIGEINGVSIDFQEFNNLVEAQKQQYEAAAGRSATEEENQQIRQQVWEKLVFEHAYVEEFEKLGITVSDDELRTLIQGSKNMHPLVKQQFSDAQGNFNQAQYNEFIKGYTENKLPAGQRVAWDGFKRELRNIRLREKYSNLIAKATYVTQAEAKSQYTAENEKAVGRMLFVPFYSISDSTVKVDNSEIKDYYAEHEGEFKPFDSRTVEYVAFQLIPTKEDSLALTNAIRELAKGLAAAPNAQSYANQNSDTRTPNLKSYGQLSEDLKSVLPSTVEGAVIGPFKEGNSYLIHKYEGIQTDSLYTARASHILFRADSTMAPEAQAQVLAQATEILSQAKSGADFATLAQQYGSDNTAKNGGDLGVFTNNGTMVKPFEAAVFGFSGAGILPSLVKTDFGYHIVKVTEAKSNVKYKLATIVKELQPAESTSNALFQQAETLRSQNKDLKSLAEAVKKNPRYTLLVASNVTPGAKNINTIPNAIEVVNWAYSNELEVGEVADRVFVLGNSYVVAGVKAAADKNKPKADDFKDAISVKLRNKKKGQTIISKLGKEQGDLNAISSKYGAGALVEDIAEINYLSAILGSAGSDPVAVGRLFGQKVGQRSRPFVGDNGAYIIETITKTVANPIADYSQYKNFVKQRYGNISLLGEQILRENAKIQDNRAKLF